MNTINTVATPPNNSEQNTIDHYTCVSPDIGYNATAGMTQPDVLAKMAGAARQRGDARRARKKVHKKRHGYDEYKQKTQQKAYRQKYDAEINTKWRACRTAKELEAQS